MCVHKFSFPEEKAYSSQATFVFEDMHVSLFVRP